MPSAICPAFVFTVALLFTTTYFFLGGLPLLINLALLAVLVWGTIELSRSA
jgi:hypothetical protein